MYFIYTYVIQMCLYLYTYTFTKLQEVLDCSCLLKEAFTDFFRAQKGFCLFRHVQGNQVKCLESCKQLWKQPPVLE